MRRAPAIALLVLGCALASAAAGTGPYLGKVREPEIPLRRLLEGRARAIRERELLDAGVDRPVSAWELGLQVVFFALLLLGVAYVLWQFGRLLYRLVTLRLRRSAGGEGTAPFDAGEEAAGDAETALRRRVADELTALSADLDTMGDPREAVIACYVRMERAFADAGAARAPTESPMELLARVLESLAVPEADLRRLTDLFTEARFSAHPVSEEMRAAARRSLDAVAGALAVRS